MIERRLLQLCIALAASVAVAAGLAGAVRGGQFFGLHGDVAADSHAHYLSGLLLGIGLAFWSTIPRIERSSAVFGVLAPIVICGGVARLVAAGLAGNPGPAALLALANETAVPALLWLWQRRVARLAAA